MQERLRIILQPARRYLEYYAHPEGALDSIADIDYAAASSDVTPDNFAMQIQWLINGEVYPLQPIRSTPEAWT